LRLNEVHVWAYPTIAPAKVVRWCGSTMDAAEHAKVRQMPAARQEPFLIARGVLRGLLASYLHVPPQAVELESGRYGKPTLRVASGDPQLTFSLSHSDAIVLCAVTRHREVGVDVEQIRRDVDFLSIAARFLSSAEQAELRDGPPGRRARAFFAGWTCKEAYVKATGEGLHRRLDSFDVSFDPDGPGGLLRDAVDDMGRWACARLPMPTGYAAAIVVEQPMSTGTQRDLAPPDGNVMRVGGSPAVLRSLRLGRVGRAEGLGG